MENSLDSKSKRKRIVLLINDKLKIIEKFDEGASVSKLATDYGVGEQTIRDIVKKRQDLQTFAASLNFNTDALCRKTISKISISDEIHRQLYDWICLKRSLGLSITEIMIQAKALAIIKNIKVQMIFKQVED